MRVHILQFLQRRVQMAADDIGRRYRLTVPGREKEPGLAFADVLLQQFCNFWMKVYVPKRTLGFQPLFNLAVTSLLTDFEKRGREFPNADRWVAAGISVA